MTNEELVDEFKNVLSGLRHFGKHRMSCVAWGPNGSVDRCTCGLMDRIAQGKVVLEQLENET